MEKLSRGILFDEKSIQLYSDWHNAALRLHDAQVVI